MDISNKNFLKKTNASQFQKLVELMEQYPHLATGSPVFGSNKISTETTWNSIATQINALGPPTRSGLEWKRVWQDQKCRLKKKISENNKSLHGTGGGPCTIINLTGLEQRIDRICHLTSAAAPSGIVLGLSKRSPPPSDTQKNENLEPPFIDLEPRSIPQVHPQIPTRSIPLLHSQIPTRSIPQLHSQIPTHNTPSTLEENKQPLHKNKKWKRNENNTDRQTFVHEQVTIQRKTLEVMAKQAEAAEEQAKALKEIANTTAAIGKSIIELIKYLKDED